MNTTEFRVWIRCESHIGSKEVTPNIVFGNQLKVLYEVWHRRIESGNKRLDFFFVKSVGPHSDCSEKTWAGMVAQKVANRFDFMQSNVKTVRQREFRAELFQLLGAIVEDLPYYTDSL